MAVAPSEITLNPSVRSGKRFIQYNPLG